MAASLFEDSHPGCFFMCFTIRVLDVPCAHCPDMVPFFDRIALWPAATHKLQTKLFEVESKLTSGTVGCGVFTIFNLDLL